MKYCVTLTVDGCIDIEVDANDYEEAREAAYSKFMESNIGDIECTDCTAKCAMSEDRQVKYFSRRKL